VGKRSKAPWSKAPRPVRRLLSMALLGHFALSYAPSLLTVSNFRTQQERSVELGVCPMQLFEHLQSPQVVAEN